MKVSVKDPVSQEDIVNHCEQEMRLNLTHAKNCFALAKGWFDQLDATEEQKTELWFRFAPFERDLMKGDKGKKEWS